MVALKIRDMKDNKTRIWVGFLPNYYWKL
ncbi:hypothetical protein NP493_2018g00000 [Ridgeia piscesae]|uniref:Uncharacterized protein n=1 Tax=Ridgeia piscesae TaxID=27915 RepID=A0AAD9JMY8_RIDPI|nr:hypothetical protein NP493_2018g00000 [Ridgeia piscesae]